MENLQVKSPHTSQEQKQTLFRAMSTSFLAAAPPILAVAVQSAWSLDYNLYSMQVSCTLIEQLEATTT